MTMTITPHNPSVEFGDFIRNHRKARSITGRSAAHNADMLPSNFSKIEHGILNPPQDPTKLKKLAVAVGIDLEIDTEAAAKFFDLAAKANESTPVDIAEIISRDEAVPLLLRTIGNKRLTKSEIDQIVSIVLKK